MVGQTQRDLCGTLRGNCMKQRVWLGHGDLVSGCLVGISQGRGSVWVTWVALLRRCLPSLRQELQDLRGSGIIGAATRPKVGLLQG
jgi:hypothetical protein